MDEDAAVRHGQSSRRAYFRELKKVRSCHFLCTFHVPMCSEHSATAMHMQRSDVRYFFEAACVSFTRVRTCFCVMLRVFAWRSECHDLDFAAGPALCGIFLVLSSPCDLFSTIMMRWNVVCC